MSWRVWAVLLVLCWVGVPLWAQGEAPPAPPAPTIATATVVGLQLTPPAVQDQVRALAQATVGTPYTPEAATTLEESALALGWFRRAEATTAPVEGGVALTLTVVENPVVQGIAFTGNTALTTAQLQSVVTSKPGQVLNSNAVREDAQAIQQAYARRGYTLAQVTGADISAEGVLTFNIAEPRVGEVRIEGNTRTRSSVIMRAIDIKPGDEYNVIPIQRSLANLDRLGVFQNVTVDTLPGLRPNEVIVVFRVEERSTGQLNFGGSYNQVSGFSGYIDYSEANLFRRAQRLQVRASFGGIHLLQVSYFNPWVDRHRTSMGLSLYDLESRRQITVGSQTLDYLENRTGGNVTFTRPFSPTTSTFVTFRADTVQATPDAGDVIPAIIEQESTVRSVSVGALHDTRLPQIFPLRGNYARLASEFAGLLGGADFTKLSADLRRYWIVRGHRPGPEDSTSVVPRGKLPWVYATRLFTGTSLGTPPFLDQFFVGGADTLRGYNEDRFPGKNMLLWNNELRIPFTESLQGVAFVDVGDAWGGPYATEFGDKAFKLHLGYGIGLRVQTPLGPLRLDFGLRGEGGSQFHFGVGTTF